MIYTNGAAENLIHYVLSYGNEMHGRGFYHLFQ